MREPLFACQNSAGAEFGSDPVGSQTKKLHGYPDFSGRGAQFRSPLTMALERARSGLRKILGDPACKAVTIS